MTRATEARTINIGFAVVARMVGKVMQVPHKLSFLSVCLVRVLYMQELQNQLVQQTLRIGNSRMACQSAI